MSGTQYQDPTRPAPAPMGEPPTDYFSDDVNNPENEDEGWPLPPGELD